MAKYIVVMDSNTHADATEAENALSTAGVVIEKTYSLNLTYEVEATAEQVSAIVGLKYSSLSDSDSGVSLQAMNTNHFLFVDNRHLDLDEAVDMVQDGTDPGYSVFQPKYTGSGKTCYLIDSGIQSSHTEFSGSTINNLFTTVDGDFDDYTGHGTFVGSLINGQNIGLAKDSTVQNVKLFDQLAGSISLGNVMNALDACLVHHNANDPSDVKVLCAPWVTTQNDIIDSKIAEINNSNIVVVASAGNQGSDVNNYSPAGVNDIITVGSHDTSYQITSFTNTPWDGEAPVTSINNYGAAIDIFTIGVNVSGAELGDTGSTYTDGTGTSVSAGIVAGGVLGYIEKHPTENSNRIKEILIAEGSLKGIQKLSLANAATDGGFSTSNTNKTILQVDAGGVNASQDLFNYPSGSVAKVQRGQSVTVDLGLNSGASNVSVLSFSPLSPWMTFDANTGILTADTSTLTADQAPSHYLFGVRGKVNGVTLVEEFAVSVYNTSEDELGEGTNAFYYDTDNDEYDQAQTLDWQLAPIITPTFMPLFGEPK